MNKRFVFRHMEPSAGLEAYVNEQLAKVERFLENEPTPVHIDIIFEPSKTREHHRVEIRVKTPHYHKVSDFEGPKFYDIVDRVIDTLYLELHEEKQKQHDHLKDIGRHDEFKKQR